MFPRVSQNPAIRVRLMLNGHFLTRRLNSFALKDGGDAQWPALCAVPEYYDTFEALVARCCNNGGGGGNLILQDDLILRAEMFRLNDQSLLTYMVRTSN